MICKNNNYSRIIVKNNDANKNVEEVSVLTIDRMIFGSTIFGLFAFIMSFFASDTPFLAPYHFIDGSFLLVIILLVLFKTKLSLRFKSITMLVGITLFVAFDSYRLGLYSDIKPLLILVPAYSLFIFNKRQTLIVFIISLSIFSGIICLHMFGVLTIERNIDLYYNNTMTLLLNIFLMIVVTWSLLVSFILHRDSYKITISRLLESNKVVKEQNLNYKKVFELPNTAICLFDMDGKIINVNKAAQEIYGYTKEEFLKLSVAELSSGINGFVKEEALQIARRVFDNEEIMLEWQGKKKDSSLFWMEVIFKKITILGEVRALTVVRDITKNKEDEKQLEIYHKNLEALVERKTKELQEANDELFSAKNTLEEQKEELLTLLDEMKSTQEQLIQSEKMSSLGVLINGMAHEINNPLNFIKGGVIGLNQYFKTKLPEHVSQTEPLIRGINEGVVRVSNILTRLGDYGKPSKGIRETIDVHELLNTCVFVIQNDIQERINIVKKYHNEAIYIECDVTTIEQVILSIMINSIESIKEKGTITLKTKIRKNFVHIQIADSGIGISKENMNKIFDPFFTTKEVGIGTGLSLSVGLKIIHLHQGDIEYKSELGKGTKAKIILPIAKQGK